MNLNKALFVGNLTANPELIHTPKGTAVVNASLAVNEFYTAEDGERQQITTYIDVKVWGPSAENFAKLAKKGQEILIDGSIRQDTWEDKDSGQKRSKLMSEHRTLFWSCSPFASHRMSIPSEKRMRLAMNPT